MKKINADRHITLENIYIQHKSEENQSRKEKYKEAEAQVLEKMIKC